MSAPLCRLCHAELTETFVDLGMSPPCESFLTADELDGGETFYPLHVRICAQCLLVQLPAYIDAGDIFSDYAYFSSYSDSWVAHAKSYVTKAVERLSLDGDSFVVEVASNDGYLLKAFVERGIDVLGIEPTPGPAAAARAAGVPTREEFFGAEMARRLVAEGVRGDVVIANNVMAHVPDLNSFVEGLSILVADDGIVSVENPGVGALLEHNEFDTIYHEHFCYFSTTAVDALMRRHGLRLVDVQHFPEIHGGTLRWRMQRADTGTDTPTPEVARVLAAEREAGLAGFERYASFGDEVRQVQTQLVDLLRSLKADGRTVAGYAAAAKGATLLNSSGIGHELVSYIVDRNVHKQGKYVPGARIPILDPSVLLERQPDYLLLLAWNVKAEIMAQQAEYARRGGRFIVPVPRPTIL